MVQDQILCYNHHLQKSKITSFTFKLSIPIVHDYDHAILVSHNWGVYVSLASLFLFHGVGGIQNHLKKNFNNFFQLFFLHLELPQRALECNSTCSN